MKIIIMIIKWKKRERERREETANFSNKSARMPPVGDTDTFYGTIFCKVTISILRDGVAATASKENEMRKKFSVNQLYRFQGEMQISWERLEEETEI